MLQLFDVEEASGSSWYYVVTGILEIMPVDTSNKILSKGGPAFAIQDL